MENNNYEWYSTERKRLQKIQEAPIWMTTAGFQLLTDKKYLFFGETPRTMYRRISGRAAELISPLIDITLFNDDTGITNWDDLIFRDLWNGWLSPSSTVLSNLGTQKGHPCSCSQTFLQDSVDGFYKARHEIAVLTKLGYGTSWNLSNVRKRGSKYGIDGIATGVTQPMNGVRQDMSDISQGSSRRGSIGQYLDVLHGDFEEVQSELISDDQGLNIGWNLTDEYIKLFTTDPEKADFIWKKIMKAKMQTGKGYLFFPDKVNRRRPQMYIDRGFSVHAANLCCEINLFSDENHTYSCVLSSVNAFRYDEWKGTMLIKRAMIFMDILIDDILEKAKADTSGMLKNIIRFTENTRAVGLGTLGGTSYIQDHNMVYGDLASRAFEHELYTLINNQSLEVSKYLAEILGEPEYMKGYGERFSHRLTMPPTKSTSVIMGGYSEGTMNMLANIFTQDTAGGNVFRINPVFLKVMKEKGFYNKETMTRIVNNNGSVQEETWLSPHQKKVFRTAFEIDQYLVLSMAAERQKKIDQGQSINLHIDDTTTEEEITKLHLAAMFDENILGLYYVRSLKGTAKHKADPDECVACHG